MMVGSPPIAALGYLLPLLGRHAGEIQMIDAPGVLDRGVCCVESPEHLIARLSFPLAIVVLIAGVLLNAITRRQPAAIEPPPAED